MNKRILFFLSRNPFVSDGGREFIINSIIRRVVSVGFLVDVIFFNNKTGDYEVPDYISSVRVLPVPSLLNAVAGVFGRYPNQANWFYCRAGREGLASCLQSHEYSYVYFDMVRLARYVGYVRNSSSAKVIFDFDDLLSVRYSRMAKLKSAVALSGSYQGNMGRWMGILFSTFSRSICRIESRRVAALEMELSSRVDLSFFTSPLEAREFKETCGGKHVVSTFPPVCVAFHDGDAADSEINTIVWVGNNYVPHNRVALEALLDQYFPDIEAKCPDVSFIVAGRTPDYLLKGRVSRKVSFLSYVDDLGDVLKPGRILIAPLVFGTGIKIKIVDSIARGVVVISNEVGLEGIDCSGNKYFRPYLASEISDVVCRLISGNIPVSAWLAEQIATAQSNFGQDNVVDALRLDYGA